MIFERKRLDLVDRSIEYLDGGDGPRLIHLHAASGVRTSPAIVDLSKSWRVNLPIAPGFDDAGEIRPVQGMPGLANHVAAFIDSVAGGPIDIVGYSFGAWVACWIAVQRPDLLRKLVLQSPAGFNSRTDEALDGDPATLLKRAFAHPEKRPPESKAPMMVAANRARAAQYTGGIAYDRELVSRLSEIGAATIIIYGKEDGVVPPESPLLLKEKIRLSELIYIDDAAHNIEIDQPEECSGAIRKFLQA